MYFEDRIPKIKNQYGNVVPWFTQGGVTIYWTARKVTITGTYITRYPQGPVSDIVYCTPDIETIR